MEAVAELDIETDGVEHEEVELPETETELEITDHDASADTEDEAGEGEEPEQPVKRKKKTFQKRMDELLYQKHDANERAAAAEARLEIETKEKEDLKKQLEEFKGGSTGSVDDEILKLRKERRDLVADDAELLRFSEIDDKLDELQERRTVSREPERREQQSRSQPQAGQQPGQQPELHKSAKAWIGRNDWFNDPEKKHLVGETLFVQKQLLDEGYGISDALYQELDRRLSELPDFDGVHEAKAKEKPRVAAPSRGGEAPARTKAGQLTDYDLRIMDNTPGLDRNNPVHRKSYLKYKGT